MFNSHRDKEYSFWFYPTNNNKNNLTHIAPNYQRMQGAYEEKRKSKIDGHNKLQIREQVNLEDLFF